MKYFKLIFKVYFLAFVFLFAISNFVYSQEVLPSWVTDNIESSNFLYGVGSAKFKTERASKEAADKNAKLEMYKAISSYLNQLCLQNSEKDIWNNYKQYLDKYITEVSMYLTESAYIKERYTAKNETVYSLSVINKDKIPFLLKTEYENRLKSINSKIEELNKKYLDLFEEYELILLDARKILKENIKCLNEEIIKIDFNELLFDLKKINV